MAESVGIGECPTHFKQYEAVIQLVVAEKCKSRKRRPVLGLRRHRRTMVDGHAEHFAIPIGHGIQICGVSP